MPAGHSQNMVNTITSMKYRQRYHHSDGVSHASVESAQVSVGTETSWTEHKSSQDSFMTLNTVQACPRERKLRFVRVYLLLERFSEMRGA